MKVTKFLRFGYEAAADGSTRGTPAVSACAGRLPFIVADELKSATSLFRPTRSIYTSWLLLAGRVLGYVESKEYYLVQMCISKFL